MKITTATALFAFAGSSILSAGDVITDTAAPEITTTSEKKVTGTLSLDAYSHFISYGADVWDDGSDAGNFAFNPSLSLNFDLGGGWSANIGTWWDVNNKNTATTFVESSTSSTGFEEVDASDPLGGNIQEIDVWAGLAYESGIYSASVTYQEWYYASDTEKILDIGLGLDLAFSPSVTIHHRIDEGASGGDEGTIAVFGLEHSFDAGPVSVSVPVSLAYFLTDDYHGDGADTGFGYASIGLQGSVPLSALSSTLGGDWNLNAGVTYYMTDDDIIVGDPEDSFFVVNAGISLDF